MKKNFGDFFREVLLVPLAFLVLGIAFLLAAFHFSADAVLISAHGQSFSIPGSDPLSKFLLKEIGFAFLVAATLAISIDFINRRKHEEAADRLVDRMKVNLFHAVFGKDLPVKIYEQVKRHVLDMDFYRTDFKVVFIFGTPGTDSENPDPKNYIKYMEQTSFVVQNITNSAKKYVIEMSLNGAESEIANGKTSYVYDDFRINNKSTEFTITRSEFEGKLDAIKEIELSPGESVKIDSATHAYVRYEDEVIFMMKLATEDASISAVSHVPNLKIRATSNHPENLEEIRVDPTFREWRQENAMFSGQGFTMNWELK
jgi:hypothetical protein